jgi:hypothetical protein
MMTELEQQQATSLSKKLRYFSGVFEAMTFNSTALLTDKPSLVFFAVTHSVKAGCARASATCERITKARINRFCIYGVHI